MSLVSTINRLASKGLTIIGDLRTPITLKLNPVSSLVDGKNITTYTDETVFGIKTRFDLNEIVNSGGSIKVTDIKVLIPFIDVTNPITVDGKAVLDGVTYQIVPPVNIDASRSLYTLQLRNS